MNRETTRTDLALTVALAGALWFFAFAVPWGNFWVKIALSAAVLGALGLALGREAMSWEFRPVDVLWGFGSAAALYGIFWAGNAVSGLLFDFADRQVGGIYALGEGTDRWVVCLLLLLVTGPAEEIYWRGFLQEGLARRLSNLAGWVIATTLYALVHLPAWNFMLISAAAVAGAFWGLLYWRLRRIWPLIISHSAWSVAVFALLPIR
ncbi:MAG: CPBP family intramembrane glutamic endopeptidase [Planctomycetota bacterium]